jgi:2-polyprenyl-3-methyl-5-hydroxy-6-metoxy-1,4-benzoquinol methylase
MNTEVINTAENPDCLICGSPDSEPFLTVPNRFRLTEKFTLRQCCNCGFVYLSPRPAENAMSAYYQDEEYQPHQQQAQSLTEKIYRQIRVRNNRYKRKLIERVKPSGKILDYGCGTGEFLLEMMDSGWDCHGYEPSEKAAKIATHHGVLLIKQLSEIPSEIDVITLWHVLEHVHQAGELLQQLAQKLAPEGFLIIALPNSTCYDARVYRENWVAWDAPRHLYHFSPGDITTLLNSLGFRITQTARLCYDPWYNVLLSEQLQAKLNGRNFSATAFIKFIAVSAISTINSLLNRNRSSSLIYIAQPHD